MHLLCQHCRQSPLLIPSQHVLHQCEFVYIIFSMNIYIYITPLLLFYLSRIRGNNAISLIICIEFITVSSHFEAPPPRELKSGLKKHHALKTWHAKFGIILLFLKYFPKKIYFRTVVGKVVGVKVPSRVIFQSNVGCNYMY